MSARILDPLAKLHRTFERLERDLAAGAVRDLEAIRTEYLTRPGPSGYKTTQNDVAFLIQQIDALRARLACAKRYQCHRVYFINAFGSKQRWVGSRRMVLGWARILRSDPIVRNVHVFAVFKKAKAKAEGKAS